MVPFLAQTNTSGVYLFHGRKQKTKWEKLRKDMFPWI